MLLALWIVLLAVKVTAGVVHLALVAALLLFVAGFFRGCSARAVR